MCSGLEVEIPKLDSVQDDDYDDKVIPKWQAEYKVYTQLAISGSLRDTVRRPLRKFSDRECIPCLKPQLSGRDICFCTHKLSHDNTLVANPQGPVISLRLKSMRERFRRKSWK
ncbi:hypothetical protein DdX_12563 [Ditylenchus destructor]|uniref:Uncharacterized protein n=1 Tax=Ditylenchus destructor TaxID=166010 RepID=A0AAD4MVD2_9BILA|nr:hypothetical protein DdX_12563 [Ditylenchus destructor]